MSRVELTERERFVLRGLAAGMTRSKIGRGLQLSASSINNVVAVLLPKLAARNAAHAVDRAWRLGLLPGEEP